MTASASNGGRLFVYGTLRPGFAGEGGALRARLTSEARHIGRGVVRGRLYRVDWYPGLTDGSSPDDRVVGDVFELPQSSDLIATLDDYEGADEGPDAEYVRRRKRVTLDDGRMVIAWAYAYNRPVDKEARIADGDFLALKRDTAKRGRAPANA